MGLASAPDSRSGLQALWKQASKTDSEHQSNAKPNGTADYETNHNIQRRASRSPREANAILALLFRFQAIHQHSTGTAIKNPIAPG
jgi:hypothetical protein